MHSLSQSSDHPPQSAVPTRPAHPDSHPPPATVAASAVIRPTKEVSYTLFRSFIDIGDNVPTCLGGGGGGREVIGFGDVRLFWCVCILFLSYNCAFLL